VFRYRRADNGDLIAIDEMLASLHLDWPQHKLLGLPLRRTAATRASRIRVVADALIKASPLVRFRREMAESIRGPGARKSQRMINGRHRASAAGLESIKNGQAAKNVGHRVD